LKKIIKQVDAAEPDIRVEILWKITDGILLQLNQYGMNDIPLEDLAINTLSQIIEIFRSDSEIKENNPAIISELKEYCEWQNCGIRDEICEAYEIIAGNAN